MATILLNGVVTDANSISGSENADKLTVSGGVDGLSAQLSGGDDLLEIYADSENLTDVELRLGTGDDEIEVRAEDGTNGNNINDGDDFVGLPMNLGGLVTGGEGDDEIDLGDGLVTLTGTVKGNEGEDTINIARVNGGTVQGLSDDDTINIGFQAGGDVAGSQAEVSLTDASINGSSGDDVIRFIDDAVVTDSSIRGNEGDDTIIISDEFGAVGDNVAPDVEVEASGSVSIEGNAGDDTILATGLSGPATIRGGQGNDTLTVGGGQTVFGGKGTDTFIVASEGGAVIGDYDNLEDQDCFCDEDIQIDGWQFDVAAYTVNTAKYTSASSWTGDIKVKAVAAGDGKDGQVTAKLTKTKTETLTAFAVARAFITDTTTLAKGKFLDALATNSDFEVKYPRVGNTKDGDTFVNGQSGPLFTTNNDGIGQAFASAQGAWYTRIPAAGGQTVKGYVNAVTAKTFTNFEKGDFSFLQLTNTAKVGVEVGQKLLFNDVTNATIKNHWASYTKSKQTLTDRTLQQINFGTAAFSTITTGKAYMVITKGLDTEKIYDTKILTNVDAAATATAVLTLDNAFEAWKRVALDPVKANNGSSKTDNGQFSWSRVEGMTMPASKNVADPTNWLRVNLNGELTLLKTTGSAVTKQNVNTYPNTLTANGGAFKTTSTTVKFLDAGKKVTGTLLSTNDLLWSTVTSRGLATLTTTASFSNTVKGVLNRPGPFIAVTRQVGINNTTLSDDDYRTRTGRLVMKVKASDIATAKATAAVNTIVERMTVTGTDLAITTCPSFPAVGELFTANGDPDRVVDGFAKHGDVTGDFNKNFVFTSNRVLGRLNSISDATSNGVLTSNALNDELAVLGFGQGFFSGAAFSVDALVKQDFGSQAVNEASDDAQGVPFRVLFLDTAGTDNGLYVVSGLANYNDGTLTGLRTNSGTVGGSTMAGKHTIVRVTGDKGHPIELSDITFI